MEKLIAKAYELLEENHFYDDDYDPWDFGIPSFNYLASYLRMLDTCQLLLNDNIVKTALSNPTTENWEMMSEYIRNSDFYWTNTHRDDNYDIKQLSIGGYIGRQIIINAYDDFEMKITKGIDWLVSEIQKSIKLIEEHL